ncbi:unnamed protein product [Musa banksii]
MTLSRLSTFPDPLRFQQSTQIRRREGRWCAWRACCPCSSSPWSTPCLCSSISSSVKYIGFLAGNTESLKGCHLLVLTSLQSRRLLMAQARLCHQWNLRDLVQKVTKMNNHSQ